MANGLKALSTTDFKEIFLLQEMEILFSKLVKKKLSWKTDY
jgi:hypothetical protein